LLFSRCQILFGAMIVSQRLSFVNRKEKIWELIAIKSQESKYPDLFNRILEACQVKNANQAAVKLGLNRKSVYQWRDGGLPEIDTLLEISRQTKHSIHWLLTGKGERLVGDSESDTPENLMAQISAMFSQVDEEARFVAQNYLRITRDHLERKINKKHSRNHA
jgi:DNA-binding phage protein